MDKANKLSLTKEQKTILVQAGSKLDRESSKKVKEVEAILSDESITFFRDFIKEQEEYISDEYAERDRHIADTIIGFFEDSGMQEDDFFYEDGSLEGWAVDWLDEGICLSKDGVPLGSVKWCYRGNSGNCWIDYE